ncbi:unnamed protein product [Effrenium voratum]|nr:unnamed protein product [Effrenium voratum]
MRQRRPVPEVEGTGNYEDDPQEKRRRAKQQEQEMAPYILGLVIFIAASVVGMLLWWNPHIEFHKAPATKRDMSKNEVHAHLRNHSILHVGGLHHSGLTLTAELLNRHPDVAGMRHQEGADKRKAHWVSDIANDGVWLQTVIPSFGLDHKQFFLWKFLSKFARRILPEETVDRHPWMKLRSGLGRFALHQGHHLDDTSPMIVSRAQIHLFSEWALFWDLSKKVLLEKSPSNVVLSPFLHRLWGLDLDSPSCGRFIFQQRHPLAVAMSTKRRGGPVVDDLSIADLVENWVCAEERRAKDAKAYFEYYGFSQAIYLLQFEDLLREPQKARGLRGPTRMK